LYGRASLTLVRFGKRLEQAYVDRLDGKITEEFWEAKSTEWQEEEQSLLASLRELERAENPERALDRVRILELANKAHSLYVTQTPQEKAKLLRMVLSNCAVDAVSVYPTYRKPFDMIFEGAKTGEWWALVDDLRTLKDSNWASGGLVERHMAG
jgi:site-specific DNA recombinase